MWVQGARDGGWTTRAASGRAGQLFREHESGRHATAASLPAICTESPAYVEGSSEATAAAKAASLTTSPSRGFSEAKAPGAESEALEPSAKQPRRSSGTCSSSQANFTVVGILSVSRRHRMRGEATGVLRNPSLQRLKRRGLWREVFFATNGVRRASSENRATAAPEPKNFEIAACID